jgi:hypothetical protein
MPRRGPLRDLGRRLGGERLGGLAGVGVGDFFLGRAPPVRHDRLDLVALDHLAAQ